MSSGRRVVISKIGSKNAKKWTISQDFASSKIFQANISKLMFSWVVETIGFENRHLKLYKKVYIIHFYGNLTENFSFLMKVSNFLGRKTFKKIIHTGTQCVHF